MVATFPAPLFPSMTILSSSGTEEDSEDGSAMESERREGKPCRTSVRLASSTHGHTAGPRMSQEKHERDGSVNLNWIIPEESKLN